MVNCMKYIPLPCQAEGTDFILDMNRSGLLFRMGIGKTVATLTAIEDLIYNRCKVRRVLVVAPKRVALFTWPDELAKWDHLHRLTHTVLHGENKDYRLKLAAPSVDITVINYEGLRWLWTNRAIMPNWDMIVFDESTYLKNTSSARTGIAMDVARKIPLVVIMTGTFQPNGIENLWSQMFMVDRGQRLGTTITTFRNNYMIPQQGGIRRKRLPLAGAKQAVLEKIKDVVLVVEDTHGVGLPPVKDNIIDMTLPPAAQKIYDEVLKEYVTVIDEEELLITSNQGQIQKLRQLASGFIYMENGTKLVHKEKLLALEEITIGTGGNILVSIQYKYEVDMIREHFGYRIPAIYSPTVTSEGNRWIREWMDGKLPIFLVHPASMAHGLNMQGGGQDIVWFSLTWDLEHWLQLIGRLRRRGSAYDTVFNHVLRMRGTIDDQLLHIVTDKDMDQEKAKQYLLDWRKSLKQLTR